MSEYLRRVVSPSIAVLLVLLPSVAQAQKLTKIGVTAVGTPVMLEARSVSTAGGIITATVRAILQPPMKTPKGDYMSTRSIAMFDCLKQTVATKERWFYYDAKGTKEARHDKPGIPGYGPATKGSLADVSLRYLCTGGEKSGVK